MSWSKDLGKYPGRGCKIIYVLISDRYHVSILAPCWMAIYEDSCVYWNHTNESNSKPFTFLGSQCDRRTYSFSNKGRTVVWIIWNYYHWKWTFCNSINISVDFLAQISSELPAEEGWESPSDWYHYLISSSAPTHYCHTVWDNQMLFLLQQKMNLQQYCNTVNAAYIVTK